MYLARRAEAERQLDGEADPERLVEAEEDASERAIEGVAEPTEA